MIHVYIYIYIYDSLFVMYIQLTQTATTALSKLQAFLVVFDRKLAWHERHDGYDSRSVWGAWAVYDPSARMFHQFKGQFQLSKHFST